MAKSGPVTQFDKYKFRKRRKNGGLPLTNEAKQRFRAKGAKFIEDIENIKFYSGEVIDISVNEAKGLDGKSWTPYRKGIIVGDYSAYILVNFGAPWKRESFLKTEILVDRVRIIRREAIAK